MLLWTIQDIKIHSWICIDAKQAKNLHQASIAIIEKSVLIGSISGQVTKWIILRYKERLIYCLKNSIVA